GEPQAPTGVDKEKPPNHNFGQGKGTERPLAGIGQQHGLQGPHHPHHPIEDASQAENAYTQGRKEPHHQENGSAAQKKQGGHGPQQSHLPEASQQKGGQSQLGSGGKEQGLHQVSRDPPFPAQPQGGSPKQNAAGCGKGQKK